MADNRENDGGGPPVPSKWRCVGRLFFRIATGPVVSILCKDSNKGAARRPMIISPVFGIVAFVALVGLLLSASTAAASASSSHKLLHLGMAGGAVPHAVFAA